MTSAKIVKGVSVVKVTLHVINYLLEVYSSQTVHSLSLKEWSISVVQDFLIKATIIKSHDLK